MSGVQPKNTPKQQPFSTYKSLLDMDPVKKNTNPSNKGFKNKNRGERRSRSRSPRRGSWRSRSRSPRRDNRRSRSRSPRRDNKKGKSGQNVKSEPRENFDVPDRSYGDLYCKACDSHMNSDLMWTLHLQGKRHLKNTKYAKEQMAEKKYDYLDEDPEAQAEIDAETAPIVGLQHVCEIRRLEQKPLYNCFLCNSTLANPLLLIEHLIGLKHRMAYLKEHDKERHQLIKDSNLKKGQVEPVVEECIAKLETDRGRGKMIVKKERPKSLFTWGVKKNSRDYDRYPTQRSERDDRGRYEQEWKRSSPLHMDRSNDYGYDDRERKYDDSPRSFDKYYDERAVEKQPDRKMPYSSQDSNRDNDDLYYNRAATTAEYLQNFRVSSPVPKRLPAADESQFVDLREFLEQKKTPSLDSNISDEVLGIISALPAVSFLQLVLFKLDNIKIESEIAVKLLDRVSNKSTMLSMDVKSKWLTPTLRMKFKESLAHNGFDVESDTRDPSKDVQELLQMVGEYKAKSSIRTSDATTSVPASNLISSYQTHPITSMDASTKSFTSQELSSYNTAAQGTSNLLSYPQDRSYTDRSSSLNTVNRESGYAQHAQNSIPSASDGTYGSGFTSSYSSNYCSIPGLTLTENNLSPEKESQASSSPFDRLQAQTRSLFGTSQWDAGNQQQASRYNY